jgi:hypothetical protein
MTDPNWNVEDFMFEFPDPDPYTGPTVDAPTLFKVKWVREFISVEILSEVDRAVAAQAELAGAILCLAAVDYLAGYYVGHQSRGRDYIAFLRSDFFPAQYHSVAEEIYGQLRNGLMHNLAAVNPWKSSKIPFMIHPNHPEHLSVIEGNRRVFSVQTFQEDLWRSWRMYSWNLIMRPEENEELIEKFNRRFNRLGGLGAMMDRIPN